MASIFQSRKDKDRDEREGLLATPTYNSVEKVPVKIPKGITTLLLIGCWYFSNIGVLLLNKYLLSIYGFKYPIFLTMLHMTACALFSYVAIAWLKIVPMQPIRSRSQFIKICALSVIFCTSVVGGNISLRFLPVSFNQAIGATTPFFTAVFAAAMTMKREAWPVYGSLIPVVVGIMVASGGEPSFHLYGFTMCMAATSARALKSVLQGILLSSDGEKLNSMNLLMYMAPIAVVVLLPATLALEDNVLGITIEKAGREGPGIFFLLFLNSGMAYFVNLTNFLVTKHTSALTLQITIQSPVHTGFGFSSRLLRRLFSSYIILVVYCQSTSNCKTGATGRQEKLSEFCPFPTAQASIRSWLDC